MAHPSQDFAGASTVTYANLRDTLEQAAHRHSRNMEASSSSSGLHRQTWSSQTSGTSQNPVNTPTSGLVNPLQRRFGLHQPTMVNTRPSQNPVVSPLIRQPPQVERSSGTQLPPSAAYTSSMVDQRLRSERAESSPAPAVASDSNWRPRNISPLSPSNGLHRQTWSSQTSGPSQNPVNTPVPGSVNLRHQRDGLHQPTTVNKATGPSQNPVVSPLIRQPALVERSSGTQLPPPAVHSSSMVDQRHRSERVKAENSPTPDSDWRPSKRMRGSLTGEAYSAALSQFLSPPPPQQPVVCPLGPPPGFPPKLPVVSPLSGIAASQVNASSTSPVEKNLPNP